MTPMLMQRPKLLELIEAAQPGEIIVYHVGSLMRDRMMGANFIETNATACAAWEQMEAGKVRLLQRKVGNSGNPLYSGTYEYQVRKLAPPYIHVEWFGPYADHNKPHAKPKLTPRPPVPAVERQPAYV